MSARAMLHPNLAPSIILDKKFAIFVGHLFVRLLTRRGRGYAMLRLAFFGNMFSPSAILASNAVAGFSGRLGRIASTTCRPLNLTDPLRKMSA